MTFFKWGLKNKQKTEQSLPYNILKNALFALNEIIFITDKDGLILFSNDLALKEYPQATEQTSLKTILRTPIIREAIESLSEGEKKNIQSEFSIKLPVEKYYNLYAELLNENEHSFILIALDDITQLKIINRKQADFVANVSHELKTPLASISGFIETMQTFAKDDPEACQQFLSIMAVQAKRMDKLIKSLMSLSKIELNQHIAPYEKVELNKVISNVCLSLLPVAQTKHINIINNINTALDITGNEDEIFQIFQNLIENAIKYSPENKKITVQLATQQEDNFIGISVIDEGYGIAEEHIDRLTERFYRVDAARHKDTGGAGLGLSIVNQIIKHHKGNLKIETALDKGSCFTVYLPEHKIDFIPDL